MELKFKGEHYRGDGIVAKRDDVVKVSKEKAEQLLADFPNDWVKPGQDKEPPATEPEKEKADKKALEGSPENKLAPKGKNK